MSAERGYMQGALAARLAILQMLLGEIADDCPDLSKERAILVLGQTKLALMRLREANGLAWPDDLHPADIIEKHLEPLL